MKEENGPLIALVAFIVLSLFFGVMAYQNKKEIDGPDPEHTMQKGIDDKVASIQSLESEISSTKFKITGFRKQIEVQQSRYEFFADSLDDYTSEYTRRLKLKESADAYDKQGQDLADKVTQRKTATLTAINKETSEVREKMEAEVSEKTKAREAAVGRTNQLNEDLVAEGKKHVQNMNYERTRLGDSKQTLSDLTHREIERAPVFTEPDGKIVFADDVHNILVINIGTAAGVHNGYRFEVFAMRPGKKKVSKGYLEVVRADASKSECRYLNRAILMPKDSFSEYVADQPEEMFSPYQQSGQKESTAAPLMGTPKPIVMGFNPQDPIVEGDFVQNPFFNPGKSYTFYIAGSKELDRDTGKQKSAIRYRWTEIKSVVEAYGGKVVNDVDINVHYIIAQKDPNSDEKFQKGVDLGIPVIYEWELFRFLDTK
jgi:hypothetical protein